MCGQYSILCLVFNRLNVLYLSSCYVCDFFDQLWCFTLFLTKVVYLLLRSWQSKTISYATRGEFLRPIKCEFRKRTPGGYFRLCVRVTMELRQNIPRRFTEEENTNLRRCLQAAFVWYVFNAVFAQNNFFLKCREKSVQCLINRIYKFVTSHNFSVERHFCMVTPILFSHHKYFLNFSLSDKSKVIKSRHSTINAGETSCTLYVYLLWEVWRLTAITFDLKSCYQCSSLARAYCVLFLSKVLFTPTTGLSAMVTEGLSAGES